jgi:hypothetical protein
MGSRVVGVAGIIASVAFAAGCGLSPSSGTPTPSNAWLSDDRITLAIELREKLGLRSDLAWVREVAELPDAAAAVLEFGIPLSLDELRGLRERSATLDTVISAVMAYAAEYPEEWASLYVDPAEGVVVALFTDHIDEHEADLRASLGASAPLVVRKADWTRSDLEAVFEHIRVDVVEGTFFLENHVYPLGVGVDEAANQVAVDVSSARMDLDAFLEEHYVAWGMLAITSDGTGARLMPTGTLTGRVVDRDGEPVPGVVIELTSAVAGAGPVGDIGNATDSNGRFRFTDVTAVSYQVWVYTSEEVGNRKLLGSDHVTVQVDRETDITIVTR